MKLLLNRYDHDDKQTIGNLYVIGYDNKIIERFDTLELPWLDNKRRVSCIPVGIYKARKHKSPKFGQSLWLQDVPNRSEILIHQGNYHSQILGCLLIGEDLSDINGDGYLDVINSRKAMRSLLNHLHQVDGVMIEIVNSN